MLDDFSPDNARRHLRELASEAPVIEISSKNGTGMNAWLDWLLAQTAALEQRSGALDSQLTGTTASAP